MDLRGNLAMQRLLELAEENLQAMELFSALLNERPDYFSAAEVEAFARDCGLPCDVAFETLLAAGCGLESDRNPRHRRLEERYFVPALRRLDAEEYRQNPYYRQVRFPEQTLGNWQMTHQRYKPYELFCYNDTCLLPDGREIPPLGYFTQEFSFPAVLENGRLWMAITPNEVETMQADIDAAFGRIAVFGLGLGYYPFMTARMERVTQITVIERERAAIELFEKHLLPQFPHREKIRVVQADAYDFLENRMGNGQFDFAYVDIWHDVLDGTPMYLRCKQLEHRAGGIPFCYWVEPSMLIWLRGLILSELQEGKGRLREMLMQRASSPEEFISLLSLDSLRALAPEIPLEAVAENPDAFPEA